MQPRHEVAEVIRIFGPELRSHYTLSSKQLQTLSTLERCRTAALGGHLYACRACGVVHPAFNSCRNRHCPKCQAVEREAWIMARQVELLPVSYYHVVFTIPDQLNNLCRHNERWMYDLLFSTSWKVLRQFAANPIWLGARTGATMILHTWGQNLMLHPHIHCIVPGGGLDKDGHWQNSRQGENFQFPVPAMAMVYKAIFLKAIFKALKKKQLLLPKDFAQGTALKKWRQVLYAKTWVAYAKRPFGGPDQVIEYLGRYTHKVAISNHRLLEVTDEIVRFNYKDYRQQGKRLEMELDGVEFLRRFCLHVLPKGFRRIRHYGILSNVCKTKALTACRKSLQVQAPLKLTLSRAPPNHSFYWYPISIDLCETSK